MENSGLLGTQVALLHAWAALKYIPNRVAGMLYAIERRSTKNWEGNILYNCNA